EACPSAALQCDAICSGASAGPPRGPAVAVEQRPPPWPTAGTWHLSRRPRSAPAPKERGGGRQALCQSRAVPNPWATRERVLVAIATAGFFPEPWRATSLPPCPAG